MNQPFREEARRVHRHEALWRPLESDPTFVLRPMFGTRAAYLGGKLMLCFSAGEEPWRGILVCTDRESQASLRAEIPSLAPHPVIPKWLYLPESADAFEEDAGRLVLFARRHDPRIGVLPGRRPVKAASARGSRPGGTCASQRGRGPRRSPRR